MNTTLKWALFIPLLLSFLIGIWNVYFKKPSIVYPKLNPIEIKLDWLRLYSLMEEDYFVQKEIGLNFRFFLPRTYFVIPKHQKALYKEPLYNEDLFNQYYGINQTMIERDIHLRQQKGKNVVKNARFIKYLTSQLSNQDEEVRMFQKKVENKEDILKQNRFFKAYCFQNKLFSNVDFNILAKYFLSDQAEILSKRILEIQKYLSKFIIVTKGKCDVMNSFEIEILFTDHEGKQKRPYVGNINNVANSSLEEKDRERLVEIDVKKNYIEGDNQYRIFHYDYDFRLKRVLHQCVSNYKYHQEWLKRQHDFFYVQPICDKNMNPQEEIRIQKRSDILLMKKIDQSRGMIRNLTIYNFLENSDKVNNKLHFYQFAQGLDQSNKEYQFNLSRLLPKTYAFNLSSQSYTSEENEFMNLNRNGMWITKPLDQLGGKGINVYQNSDSIKEYINQTKFSSVNNKYIEDGQMIVQKYIENPLLVNGKKFDIRSYVIVVSTDPYIVYYLPGYVRLTINDYNKSDTSLLTHLVNTNIQKTHPQFKSKKDDSHWDMDRFEQTLVKEYNMTKNSIETQIYIQMKKASSYLFKGLEQFFNKRNANFQIFGLDFMFDDQFKPYFIEVNEIPQLLGQTSTHNKVCPDIVYQQLDSCFYANGQVIKGETIDMEILQKKCKHCNLLINQQDIYYLPKQ